MSRRAMSESERAVKANKIKFVAKKRIENEDYFKVRMIDIAKEVGISNGNLFQYFATKESLFLSILTDEYLERLDKFIGLIESKDRLSLVETKNLFETDMFELLQSDFLMLKLLSLKPIFIEREGLSDWFIPLQTISEEKISTIVDAILKKQEFFTQSQILDILSMETTLANSYYANIRIADALIPDANKEEIDMVNLNILKKILSQFRVFLFGLSETKSQISSKTKRAKPIKRSRPVTKTLASQKKTEEQPVKSEKKKKSIVIEEVKDVDGEVVKKKDKKKKKAKDKDKKEKTEKSKKKDKKKKSKK